MWNIKAKNKSRALSIWVVIVLAVLLLVVLALKMSVGVVSAEMMHGLNGNMQTATPFRAGANECYRVVNNVAQGEKIMVLAQNDSGSWLFIWSEAGDGWVRTGTVNIIGDQASLPTWQDHFAGESCGSQPARRLTFDSRICGQAGNDTTATTVRWTDIFATADPDVATGRSYAADTPLTLIGRDFWGCWVRVRSTAAAGNGWIPVQAIDTRGILSLPILVDNSGGCKIINGQISGCNNDEDITLGDIRTVKGRTIIYNEPSISTPTQRAVPAEGRVRVVSERPGWVRVRSRYGNGYIQLSQLNTASPNDALARMVQNSSLYTSPDFESAVTGTVRINEQVTVTGFASGWIKVKTLASEGWVPAPTVARR